MNKELVSIKCDAEHVD